MENVERNTLLQNLYEAADIIARAEAASRQYMATLASVRRMRRKREYVNIDDRITTKATDFLRSALFWIILAPFVLFLLLGTLASFATGNMTPGLFLRLVLLVVMIGVPVHIIRKNKKIKRTQARSARDQQGRAQTVLLNAQIDEENAKIEAENAVIIKQAEALAEEIAQIQALADQRLTWYPRDYCYSHAVRYFISTVENYRADTIKEAVNLYIEELRHQEHMEKLDTQNMLTAANLYTNQQIHAAIKENTAAIHQEGDRIVGAINLNTDAVYQNTDAIYRAGQQISGNLKDIHNTLKKWR